MNIRKAYPISDDMNAECERIQAALEQAQKNLDRLARESGEAEGLFKKLYHQKIVALIDDLKFKTDKLKEAKAHADYAQEYLDYKLKEKLFESAKQAVYTWRAELSAWQTRCGNIKAEKEVSAVGAPAQPQWSKQWD